MKRVLVVFGTRPEAIKLAPLIKALREAQRGFDVVTCVTAQHREMLDQVLRFFDIQPDIDLNLMRPDQSLPRLTAESLTRLSTIVADCRPDLVLVQGDTTTAFAGALAGFYERVPVGHVEAGLRTHDIYAPFPEEVNRRLISAIATVHFAPTERAAESLVREGAHRDAILVTGNTVVDALQLGLGIIAGDLRIRRELEEWFAEAIGMSDRIAVGKSRLILVTGHRRESFGVGLRSICSAVRDLAQLYPDHAFVYPVHLNPNVWRPVSEMLAGQPNVFLLEPVEYPRMLFLATRAYLILTDSGGIQEEAPSLRVPVVVLRNKTERPEGVEGGCALLVGSRREEIVRQVSRLLEDPESYARMQIEKNPYGDGRASERILAKIKEL